MHKGRPYPFIRQRDWWFARLNNITPPGVSWRINVAGAQGTLAPYWGVGHVSDFATYDLATSTIEWIFPTPPGCPTPCRLILTYKTLAPPQTEPGQLFAQVDVNGVLGPVANNGFLSNKGILNNLILIEWPVLAIGPASGVDLRFTGNLKIWPTRYNQKAVYPPLPW